jgi:phospholipid transport system transporter-binding protein
MDASVQLEGDALVFRGRLGRDAVPALWRTLEAKQAGITRVRLQQVDSVDSAGIAMLAELAARRPQGLVVEGMPAGLAELRTAYRLDEQLRFA